MGNVWQMVAIKKVVYHPLIDNGDVPAPVPS